MKDSGIWKIEGASIYFEFHAVDNPIGIIVISHGLGEHFGRYRHMISFFQSNHYAVLGYDHYGHGKSSGKRGDVPEYSFYHRELDVALQEAKQLVPAVPVILLGHSMGGNIVLNYALAHDNFDKVIATSPALTLPKPPPVLLLWIGRFANLFGGFVQDNGLELVGLSNSDDVIKDYKGDDLVHTKISSVLAIGMLDAADEIFAKRIKLKSSNVLITHGSADTITSHKGSQALCEKYNYQLNIYSGWKHELHNEPEQNSYFNDLLKWIQS